MKITIAAAAYPLDRFDTFDEWAIKQDAWVRDAAVLGADLLVFPEYGAMELAALAGLDVAIDLEASIDAVSDRMSQMAEHFQTLAMRHAVHILAPSGPVRRGRKVVNRAVLIAPCGALGFQDKQIMTRFETEDWGIEGAEPLKLFETALGKIGVLICYDSEFPLLARALVEAGAEIILVPSCTETLAGYSRVRIGSMARALEGQCVVAMASLVGRADWCPAVDLNSGTGGIFVPPNQGFPETGVLACGELDQIGWTLAEVDLDQIKEVRRDGTTLNMRDWVTQGRGLEITHERL